MEKKLSWQDIDKILNPVNIALAALHAAFHQLQMEEQKGACLGVIYAARRRVYEALEEAEKAIARAGYVSQKILEEIEGFRLRFPRH